MKTISELISSMIGVTRLSLVIVIQRDDAQTDPADLAVANLGQDGRHQVVLVPLHSALCPLHSALCILHSVPGTRHHPQL